MTLRRRPVTRVGAVYAGTAFVILQVGDILVQPFGLPEWTVRMVPFLLIPGLPVAVGLDWIFDRTEDERRRTDEVIGRFYQTDYFTGSHYLRPCIHRPKIDPELKPRRDEPEFQRGPGIADLDDAANDRLLNRLSPTLRDLWINLVPGGSNRPWDPSLRGTL